ncbi:MAG: sigma factor [Kofleriaceae bacterium]
MAARVRIDRAPEDLDLATLARAKTGEPAALRALIELYQDRVYALVWRMLIGRAQHLTQDLAQETFVRVLRGLGSFDVAGAARLSTWIITSIGAAN